MKVGKEAIKFAINQLMLFYPEFCKHVQYVGDDKIADGWFNMFNKIDYDYDLAEQDFKQSIFDLIRFSNKAPAFSDILDGMRELDAQHEKEELERKIKARRKTEQQNNN